MTTRMDTDTNADMAAEASASTAKLLADAIAGALRGTELGHCARVDFLSRDETLAVCRVLRERQIGDVNAFAVRILSPDAGEGEPYITTDEAIEIRNRKQTRLCLFVPSDTVDAAYSSLANSFAPLDGRALHATALQRLLGRLPDAARRLVRDVRAVLRRPLHVGDDQILDFVVAVLALATKDAQDSAGMDLWRVGLVADARTDFTAFLDLNRRAALRLTRPAKLTATARERIAALGVDVATADQLLAFFASRAVYDARVVAGAGGGRGPNVRSLGFPTAGPQRCPRGHDSAVRDC